MSVVTAPENGQRDSLSIQDLVKYLESIKISAEDVARKFADIDARLKKLEDAEEARRKTSETEEAGSKAEEAETAETAEDTVLEAEDGEKNKRRLDAQSILAKSRTSNKTETAGIPKWASEIIDSMKRVLG